MPIPTFSFDLKKTKEPNVFHKTINAFSEGAVETLRALHLAALFPTSAIASRLPKNMTTLKLNKSLAILSANITHKIATMQLDYYCKRDKHFFSGETARNKIDKLHAEKVVQVNEALQDTKANINGVFINTLNGVDSLHRKAKSGVIKGSIAAINNFVFNDFGKANVYFSRDENQAIVGSTKYYGVPSFRGMKMQTDGANTIVKTVDSDKVIDARLKTAQEINTKRRETQQNNTKGDQTPKLEIATKEQVLS